MTDHNDICENCDSGGDLLCCDFCNLVSGSVLSVLCPAVKFVPGRSGVAHQTAVLDTAQHGLTEERLAVRARSQDSEQQAHSGCYACFRRSD